MGKNEEGELYEIPKFKQVRNFLTPECYKATDIGWYFKVFG
jgi:hypothetical protein